MDAVHTTVRHPVSYSDDRGRTGQATFRRSASLEWPSRGWGIPEMGPKRSQTFQDHQPAQKLLDCGKFECIISCLEAACPSEDGQTGNPGSGERGLNEQDAAAGLDFSQEPNGACVLKPTYQSVNSASIS